jgi:predicted CXXCH cytochrome family protein
VAENAKLLGKTVPALCLECHEQPDLDKVKAHQSAPDKNACLGCHDPHQSTRERLLKSGVKTAAVRLWR